MRVASVEFDHGIIDALKEDRLVIFAGAGVSMGEPASLMNFRSLAESIGIYSQFPFEDEDGQNPEVYLGKLKSSGVKIYKRLNQVLNIEESKFTPLHENIIRLFQKPDKCRIITTNYDLFFEDAFRGLYKKDPNRFVSPALPLGKDFYGIVHVHGALRETNDGIVLTDDDFGRAYLTEGWARRFLRDVFENNIVLFVGYTHNDTVVKYLARGLPPSNFQRYALVGQKEKINHWNHLRINTIKFPQKTENDFDLLTNFFEELSDLNSKGALELERFIKETISSPSTMDYETESNLHWYFTKEHTTRFFCKYASDSEWLSWVHKFGYLDFLFEEDFDYQKNSSLLNWFTKFCITESQKCLEIIHSKIQKPNIHLIRNILIELSNLKNQENVGDLFRLWVPILLNRIDEWDYSIDIRFFKNLWEKSDVSLFLLVFENYLTPYIKTRKSFGFDLKDESKRLIDFEISHTVEEHLLRNIVEEIIKPNIYSIASEIFEISIRNIQYTFRLNESLGKADVHFDPVSVGRSAIEPHEQDEHYEVDDFIIDIARDSMEILFDDSTFDIKSLLNRLFIDKSKVVKRIGIHGLIETQSITDNAKLDELIDRGWLTDFRLLHEVYRLINQTFKNLNEESKTNYLNNFLKTHKEMADEFENKNAENLAWLNFKLLKWIQKEDDSERITNLIADIEKEYPDFKPTKYLDLNSWTSGGSIGWKSPIDKEKLLSLSGNKAIDYINQVLPRDDYKRLRDSHVLTQTIEEDWKWGLSFISNLVLNEIDDADIYRSVVSSFTKKSINELLDDSLYGSISSGVFIRNAGNELASLIRDKLNVVKEAEGLVFERLELILDQLWEVSKNQESTMLTGDWLDKAINHPVGNVTICWSKIISLLEDEHELKEQILTTRLKKIITEKCTSRPMALSILGSNYGFFLGINPQWVKDNLIDLFDFEKEDDSLAVWDGWLIWGRMTIENLKLLKPSYLQAINRLANDKYHQSSRFSVHLANVAMFACEDPIQEIIIPYTIGAVENSRHEIIESINQILETLELDHRTDHWNKWIKDYMDLRASSFPVALNTSEYEELLDWLTKFENEFEEVVDSFLKFSPLPINHSSFFYEVSRDNRDKFSPEALIRLILHILEADFRVHFCHSLRELYTHFQEVKVDESLLKEYGDRLSILNCI